MHGCPLPRLGVPGLAPTMSLCPIDRSAGTQVALPLAVLLRLNECIDKSFGGRFDKLVECLGQRVRPGICRHDALGSQAHPPTYHIDTFETPVPP